MIMTDNNYAKNNKNNKDNSDSKKDKGAKDDNYAMIVSVSSIWRKWQMWSFLHFCLLRSPQNDRHVTILYLLDFSASQIRFLRRFYSHKAFLAIVNLVNRIC